MKRKVALEEDGDQKEDESSSVFFFQTFRGSCFAPGTMAMRRQASVQSRVCLESGDESEYDEESTDSSRPIVK